MKNTFVKVLSFMMALTMIVGAFGAITVSAAGCAHEDRTEIAVVAPTCAVAGFTRYECNDCGEEFIDSIKSATGKHSWKNVAESKATCDEPGYAAHKVCTVCEATDPADLSTIIVESAKGHAYNIDYKQAATCTEDGFTSKKCARCGKVDDVLKENGGNKEVSATDKAAHKFIYTVVTAPTACEDGVIKVTCSACDYASTILEEEDHNWVTMTTTTEIKADSNKGCAYEYVSGKFCADCKVIHPDSVKNTAPVHGYVEVTFDTITAENLTSEIQGLGYNVGDATSTAVATQCVAVRVYLAQCSDCGKYAKAEKVLDEGKGHKWVKDGAAYYEDGTPSHKEDQLQDYKCDNVLEDGTTKCSATKTEVAKAATACTYTKEGAKKVTAPTCESNGYTTYKCDECGTETKGDVTFKTGHNYGAAEYKSGTCGASVVYVQKCPNKGCEAPEKAVTTLPEGATEHKWVKVTRAATCIANAYYEYECSVCKATKAYDKTDAPAAGFAPANHVAKVTNGVVSGVLATVGPDADGDDVIDVPGLLQAEIVKQTCTTSRVDRYMCQCGVAVDLTVGPAPTHTKGTSYTDANGKTTSVDVVAANCKEAGIKTAGEICTVCGVILKAPVVDPINPNAHKNADSAVAIDSDVKTCSAEAYTKMYYSCCGIVHTIKTSTDKDADNHTTKGVSNIKAVAEVPATCIANGTAAHYKCSGCGKLFSDEAGTTAVTAASLVLKNPGDDLKHDWNSDPVAKVEETCTTEGSLAYYTCKSATCSAIKIGDKVVEARADKTTETDPINKQYPDLKIAAHGQAYMGWHKGVEATCTTDGYTIKGGYTSVYACSKCDKVTVGKTNHANSDYEEINDKTGGEYDCTLPTYELHICPDCGYSFFANYEKAAKTAHVYTQDADKKDVADKPGIPTCTEAAQDEYWCTECDYIDYRPGKAATGHEITVNGVKIKVDFGCTSADHVTYKGFKCVCGLELGKDSEHKVVTAQAKAPTCTTTGNLEFDYCVDCGKIVDGTVVEIPATGHNEYSDLIEVVDGVAKYSCPDCGEFWTESVIDNVSVEAEFSSTLVTAGSTFTVDVFVNADNFAFNEFEIDCSAWDSAFELVKVELTDALPATAHADFDSDGYFWIYSEHDAEGKPGFITLNGEKINIATLTFKVADVAEPDEYTFEVGPYDAVVGFDEDGYAIESEILADYVEYDVTVALAGDLNGDYMIGTSDVQKVMYIVSTGANDLVADVNRDGVVDVFDIAALRKFTSSDYSGYDYLVMTGVDVEAVAAKYKADMNEDGYINDSDKVLFVDFVVDFLQDEYYMDFLVGMSRMGFADLDDYCAELARYIAIEGVPSLD